MGHIGPYRCIGRSYWVILGRIGPYRVVILGHSDASIGHIGSYRVILGGHIGWSYWVIDASIGHIDNGCSDCWSDCWSDCCGD